MCTRVSAPLFPPSVTQLPGWATAPVNLWLTAEPLIIKKKTKNTKTNNKKKQIPTFPPKATQPNTKPICKTIFLFHHFSDFISRALALLAGGQLGSSGPPCLAQSCHVAFASAASSGESNTVKAGAGFLLYCNSADFVVSGVWDELFQSVL